MEIHFQTWLEIESLRHESTAMSYVKQQISDELNVLPINEQQKVLDFVRDLRARFVEDSARTESQPKQPKTFGEVIHKYAGRVDSGHTDLATNKAHMEGFGKV